jgi:hypothetical protein
MQKSAKEQIRKSAFVIVAVFVTIIALLVELKDGPENANIFATVGVTFFVLLLVLQKTLGMIHWPRNSYKRVVTAILFALFAIGIILLTIKLGSEYLNVVNAILIILIAGFEMSEK